MAGIIANQQNQGTSAVTGMIVISAALILAALPAFMIGGLAVQIKEELGLTETSLGAAVTVGFLIGSVLAPFGGRNADRIGPRKAIYLGITMSSVALLGLGLVTSNWALLVVFLALGGTSIAFTDPGLAILISRTIPVPRQGLAFGIKEASIPAATLAAGVAVPTIALTVGWRWSFLLGLIPLTLILILLPRIHVGEAPVVANRSVDTASGSGGPPRSALLLATVAGGLGIAAASGVGIFLTDSAVAMGMGPAAAGMLLALGSVAGIIARISFGVLADRRGGTHFRLIAAMLAVGAIATALGATGVHLLLVVATIGNFAAGWAWTGIFFLSLVRSYPGRPGAVAGIATAGLAIGNGVGPVLFGLTADTWSYGAAWLGAAAVAALAAAAMYIARRHF